MILADRAAPHVLRDPPGSPDASDTIRRLPTGVTDMTGTAKHTPGPWSCVDTSNHAHDYRLTKPNGDLLPVNAPGNDHSEQRANALLIAAAPDMLAEIDKQIEWLRHLRAEIGDSIRPSLLMGIDQSIKYLGLVSAKARG